MEVVRLIAHSRSQTGKGAARQLRQKGRLPAVLYGRGESVAVSVDHKDFMKVQRTGAGGNAILDFELQGETPETCNAIVRDLQIDALTDDVLHIDFYRLDMNQPITVSVSLEFVKVPEDRLKTAGATWRSLLRELDVRCLPRDIPAQLAVDLQALEVGVTLHAGDIALPDGVTLDVDADEVVVTVTAIAVETSGDVDSVTVLAAQEPEAAPSG
ncbi:MAG: 50S ribosomal protein L25 [bacterium]|nr:50S ribosomal protein L25 [bacterium]